MNDLISRLSEMRSDYNCMDENDEPYYRALSEAIQLASAQRERTGKWIRISPAKIYECSLCGKNVMTADIDEYHFCHGCGARMEDTE